MTVNTKGWQFLYVDGEYKDKSIWISPVSLEDWIEEEGYLLDSILGDENGYFIEIYYKHSNDSPNWVIIINSTDSCCLIQCFSWIDLMDCVIKIKSFIDIMNKRKEK